MRALSWLMVISGLVCAAGDLVAASSVIHERYIGILRHPDLNRDQLAKLDLIVGNNGKNGSPEIIGILSLSLGDFASHEYVTYHYDNVAFDPASGGLVFDQTDQPVTILTTRFTGDTLEADVLSVWGEHPAKLLLSATGPAKPGLPLVQPVWGEYEGQCHGERQRLQLSTYRNYEDTTKVGEAFASYRIAGQIGVDDPKGVLCGGTGTLCARYFLDSGAYNFFNADLNLDFRRHENHCSEVDGGLRCGRCFFRRISSETAKSVFFSPPRAKPAFPSSEIPYPPVGQGKGKLHSGSFNGYLHHEFLDEYQRVTLKLAVYEDPRRKGKEHLSAMAKLLFDQFNGPEFIPFRFSNITFPDALHPVVLLKNREADTDAIVQVRSIGKHALVGVWYSRLFGRVGTFEVRNDHLPAISPGARVMGRVSGLYESTDYRLKLEVHQGKTPYNTDNPFFPNEIRGYLSPTWIGGQDPIRIGTYDYFTGRIGLELKSGRVLVGNRHPGDFYFLNRTVSTFDTILPPHVFTPFRRVPAEGRN